MIYFLCIAYLLYFMLVLKFLLSCFATSQMCIFAFQIVEVSLTNSYYSVCVCLSVRVTVFLKILMQTKHIVDKKQPELE